MLCKCGCGLEAKVGNKYINGHNMKGTHWLLSRKLLPNLGRPRTLNRDFATEDIIYLYWELELPIYKTAELLLTSAGVVSYKMNEWGIPKRTPSEEQSGERNGFKGKHHTQETIDKLRFNEERNRKIGLAHKGIHKPGKENAIKGASKIAEYRRKEWLDPIKREKQLKSMAKGLQIRPTKPELELEKLIELACPNEYIYTGDGSLIICGKWPDFTNINGKKKVIEMYGDYWHRNDNPQDRIDIFAKFGFGCLVIWESELKNKPEEELVKTIKDFNNV